MLEKSIVQRAQVILLGFHQRQNIEIAELVELERHCVGRWRRRWQDSVDAFNQIEVIFGVIVNRVTRTGNFASQTDLKEKLIAFIDYFNRTFAKPLNWTYTGKPKISEKTERPRTWGENRQNKRLKEIFALVA